MSGRDKLTQAVIAKAVNCNCDVQNVEMDEPVRDDTIDKSVAGEIEFELHDHVHYPLLHVLTLLNNYIIRDYVAACTADTIEMMNSQHSLSTLR